MTVGRRRFMTIAGSALAATLGFAARAAEPEPDLWPRWADHDPDSTARINHSAWRRFLLRYIAQGEDGITRVPYGAVAEADRDTLDGYVESLTALTIAGYSREEQFAYWINLYNAETMQLVLDHYPVASIMDISISPDVYSFGPWDKKLIAMDGETLSLDDIEHRILRPIWRDPRIHYAINCASVGGPNLRRSPFSGANVEPLLTIAAKDYINHARGADVRDGKLQVSSLYRWYAEDFGDSDLAVIEHLRSFARPPLAAALAGIETISGTDYDWSLNDTAA